MSRIESNHFVPAVQQLPKYTLEKKSDLFHSVEGHNLETMKYQIIVRNIITKVELDHVSRVTGIPGWYWILEIKCSDTTGVGLVY